MTVRLAINGFGRIGRTVLRALWEHKCRDIEVVAINDLYPCKTLAHLFEYDSLHGRHRAGVKHTANTLDIGLGAMRVTAQPDLTKLPWQDVDIVLECTGCFTTREAALRHLENGSRRVLLSAPSKDDMKTVVFGVNDGIILADDLVISNASCTTNCLVPTVQVLHSAFGIKRGMMTTVHCYTGTQPMQDAPHPNINRGRAAALSMVPTSTGAGETLGRVLPELAGRITAQAIRVPTPNVSCCDLSVEVGHEVSVSKVNAAFEAAATGVLSGILATTSEALVSSDLKQDSHSAIIAVDQTRVQDGTWVRVLAWYDNEWGFSNRLLDTAKRMADVAKTPPS